MKLGLRPCTLLDILAVYGAVCSQEREQITALGFSADDSDVAAKIWSYGGPRLCLCVNETLEPVGVFGCYEVRPRHWRVWMFAKADAFEHYGAEITQNVGNAMAQAFKELDAERFELIVLARRLLAQRWYVKLGFKIAGWLHGDRAEDFTMYTYQGEAP